jgi:hypothetical protein
MLEPLTRCFYLSDLVLKSLSSTTLDVCAPIPNGENRGAVCDLIFKEVTMANFPTHLAIGTIVSGAAATLTLAADVVAPENLVAVTLAGVLGSVLPDIDLKDSKPSRAMFTGLSVFFSFAVLFEMAAKLSVAEMLIIWLGTLFFVRYVALAAGDCFCVVADGCSLRSFTQPPAGCRMARRCLHGAWLHDAPRTRRDLFSRCDGYPDQAVVRDRR